MCLRAMLYPLSYRGTSFFHKGGTGGPHPTQNAVSTRVELVASAATRRRRSNQLNYETERGGSCGDRAAVDRAVRHGGGAERTR